MLHNGGSAGGHWRRRISDSRFREFFNRRLAFAGTHGARGHGVPGSGGSKGGDLHRDVHLGRFGLCHHQRHAALLHDKLQLRGHDRHHCHITGPGANQLTISGANTYPILQIRTTAFPTVSISGLTFANGLTILDSVLSGNASYDVGGGIENDCTLTAEDSTISGNSATLHGGGIANDSGATALIIECTIYNNSDSTAGSGGIENQGTLTITSSTIWDNADNDPSGGGGINATYGTLILNNSIVADNTSSVPGRRTLMDPTPAPAM